MLGFLNRRIKKHCLDPFCTIITGDRGTGKSSVFALIAEQYLKLGYKVYCQYPYKGVYQIPMTKKLINGVEKADVNKNWLYTANLSNSVVLIDEARTVWPARGYASWTQADDEFFNFLRKNDTRLFVATQAYDALDLNVKRASDETWFLTKGFLHLTHIEASHTTIAKIADNNTTVLGRMFKAGMQKVVWDICEVPVGNFLFWRRPYYGKFMTLFTFDEKPCIPVPLWDDIIFNAQNEQSGEGESSAPQTEGAA